MLRLLDNDFNIIKTIPRLESFIWNRRFTEGGSFSMNLPPGRIVNTDLMDKLIFYDGTYGIIQYIDTTHEKTNIKGYDLKGILSFRQTVKKTYAGNVETVIKDIVSDNTQNERAFPNFEIKTDLKRGDVIEYKIEKPNTVENILKPICETHDIGYDVTVENGKMQFDIIVPKTVNHVYSQRRKNISGYEYCVDKLSEKNIITNYGYAEALDAEIVTVSNTAYIHFKKGKICFPSGDIIEAELSTNSVKCTSLDNYIYAYISSGNVFFEKRTSTTEDTDKVLLAYVISDTSGTRIAATYPTSNTYTLYSGTSEPSGLKRKEVFLDSSEETLTLNNKMNEQLQGGKAAENVFADITAYNDYKTLWDLGDYVYIKVYAAGQSLTVLKQITEIETTYEASNIKMKPTFGKVKDNIIRKIIKGRN